MKYQKLRIDESVAIYIAVFCLFLKFNLGRDGRFSNYTIPVKMTFRKYKKHDRPFLVGVCCQMSARKRYYNTELCSNVV